MSHRILALSSICLKGNGDWESKVCESLRSVQEVGALDVPLLEVHDSLGTIRLSLSHRFLEAFKHEYPTMSD